MFQEDIGIPMSENDNDNCCGGTLRYKCNGLAINPEGDLYPCLRYMPSSLNNKQIPLNIGSINNGIGSNETEQQNITLLSTTKYKGTGCSNNGWYKISIKKLKIRHDR